MNNLVPVAPNSFAELQMIPFQRDIPRKTPLEDVFAAVYRQRYIIAGSIGICIAIAAIITVFWPRHYTATASVQMDQQTPQIFGDNNLYPEPVVQDSDRFLQTQVDRLRSRSIADRVLDDLHIVKSPAAIHALGVTPTDPRTTRALLVQALQTNMQVALGLNTRVAQISFTSPDPRLSANAANGFANALSDSNLDIKAQASERAKQYLQQQLADAKQRLETSEQDMLAYARKQNLTTPVAQNLDRSEDPSLRSQQLGQLTNSLAQAQAQRINAQQRWAQVQNTAPLSIPEVEQNRAVQDLVSQKAQLQATLDEDRQRYTDAFPAIKELGAQIKQIDSQISSFASSIKSSFYGQYLAAAEQERQMRQEVSGLTGAAMSERERSVGFNALSREVDTNKAFYEGLLQRYKEIAAESGDTAGNISLVDRASPPLTPDSANWLRNLALGGVSGLIMALLVGSVRERMHKVVRSSEDVERDLNVPALGVVPRLTGPEGIEAALKNPHSAQTEAYHSIAAALEDAASGTLPKTLLVTSSLPFEGKSTSARAIARSLSAMGKRVLLIDADLRRRSPTKFLADGSDPGLSQVLAGSAKAEKTVQDVDGDGFKIIRSGDAECNPISLLAANRIKKVLDRLADDHDVVIIDGPPVMGLVDAVLLARSVEGVVVVIEANKTHLTDVDVALSRLPQTNIVGGVITKFDPKSAGVRYGGYNYYTYQQAQ
jgi:capsular exopolysaccharide synthesis family protein